MAITEFVDFKDQASNLETPTVGTHDLGGSTVDAVRPFAASGERVTAAVLNRPLSVLERRSSLLSAEVADLKYLSDFDKAFTVDVGTVVWSGPTLTSGADGLGIFTISSNMVIRPFLAPLASTRASTTLRNVTFQTAIYGEIADVIPRAYSGANQLSVKVTGSIGATLAIALLTTDAYPGIEVTVNTNASTGTTRQQVVDFVNASADAQSIGIKAVLAAGTGTEIYAPDPPSFVYDADNDYPLLKGALDAEQHVVTIVGLATFFTTLDNRLKVGDTLALGYSDLVGTAYSGRRQSISGNPENSETANTNLFVIRQSSILTPGAIPIARVLSDGSLTLLNQVNTAAASTSGIIPSIQVKPATYEPAGQPYSIPVTDTLQDTLVTVVDGLNTLSETPTSLTVETTGVIVELAAHGGGGRLMTTTGQPMELGANNTVSWKIKTTGELTASGSNRQLQMVAPGTLSNDAVNYGQLLTTNDKITQMQLSVWEDRVGAATGGFNSIAISGSDRMCIVGNSSVCYTSDDLGYTWTARTDLATATTSAHMNSVVWGNGLFCAVGAGGAIATSPDGETWTLQTSGTTAVLSGVAYSGTEFVAVGALVYSRSLNGVAWTSTVSTYSYTDITWVTNTCFVAVGLSGRYFISLDGSVVIEGTSGTSALYGVTSTYDSSLGSYKVYAVGYAGVFVEGDVVTTPSLSVTWGAEESTLVTTILNTCVVFNNNIVAVGDSGICITTNVAARFWRRRRLPSITQHFQGIVSNAEGTGLIAVGGTDAIIACPVID